MPRTIDRIMASMCVLLLFGCAQTTPASQSETPSIIPTMASSVVAPSPTNVPVMTATAVANNNSATPEVATSVAETTSGPDALAFLTADGYHAIGDPQAPVVMMDYSDFF